MKEKIVRLIELTAERENASLKMDYLGEKGNSSAAGDLLKKVRQMDSEINVLSAALRSKGIDFYLLGFDKLIETEKLSGYSCSEKVAAIEQKQGEIFNLIRTRLTILKENSELKNELAKALFLISMIKGSESDFIKQELLDSIKAKRNVKAMRFTSNMPAVNALLTIFSRLGLYSDSAEKKYIVQRNTIWLGKKEAEEMDSIVKELDLIEPKLQWKNAQRQIKILTDEEEKEFADIQKRYLELLNTRDALVAEYSRKEEALLALKAV